MSDSENGNEAETEEAPDPDEVTGNGGTTTSAYRWKGLSSFVTVLVVVGYVGLLIGTGIGYIQTPDTGTWAMFSLAFIAVIAYSVGVDTLRAAAEVWKDTRG